MNAFEIVFALATSTILFVLGSYVFLRSERSPAMVFTVLMMYSAAIGNAVIPLLVAAESIDMANLFAKISSVAFSMMLITLLFLVLVLPYNYALIASAIRKRLFFLSYAISVIITSVLVFAISTAVPFSPDDFWISEEALLIFLIIMPVVFIPSLLIDAIIYRTTEYGRGTATYFGGAILCFVASFAISIFMGASPSTWFYIDMGLLAGLGLIAYLFLTNKVRMVQPVQEALSVSSKSRYKLLSGRVYVVEEEKPQFAFELFGEILKRRCFDCMNDESFSCESLDCRLCSLPCPCRECKQHKSRTQGLVITRKHPMEVRIDYMIQTTPIIWLTSIPGKDNIDPSKLSLLTDMIVNFIEKSQNGVVIIDGIEYLVTANDFSRVIRAIDRWSEVVMANNSRLVISATPNAFEPRELALLERNREVVKLTDKGSFEKILAARKIGI